MNMANDKCQCKNDLYTGLYTLNSFNYLKLFTTWWDIISFCVGVAWRGHLPIFLCFHLTCAKYGNSTNKFTICNLQLQCVMPTQPHAQNQTLLCVMRKVTVTTILFPLDLCLLKIPDTTDDDDELPHIEVAKVGGAGHVVNGVAAAAVATATAPAPDPDAHSVHSDCDKCKCAEDDDKKVFFLICV